MSQPPTPTPSHCTCSPCPHCRRQEQAWQRLAEQEREREIEEAGGVPAYLAQQEEGPYGLGGLPPW